MKTLKTNKLRVTKDQLKTDNSLVITNPKVINKQREITKSPNALDSKGRPEILRFYKSGKEIERDADAYFKQCLKDERPPTFSGVALAIHLSRGAFTKYSPDYPFYKNITKIRQLTEDCIEQLLYSSKPIGAIFALKNNCEWRDVQDNKIDLDLKINVVRYNKDEQNNG